MTQQHSIPCVGAHFRPPAKALIQALPAGQALRLQREPDNQYDPHAIQVWLDSGAIGPDSLAALPALLAGFGWTLDQVLGEPAWHLGFLASKPPKGQSYSALAPEIAPRLDAGASLGPTTLAFDASGNPQVRFTLGEANYEEA